MKFKTLLPVAAGAVLLFSCSSPADDLQAELDKIDIENSIEQAMDEAETALAEDEDFVSEDGKYSINFPGTPVGTDQKEPTAVGDIVIHMDMYEKSATEVFMVGYNDYPSELVEMSDPKEMLVGGIEGAKSSMGCDVEDFREMGELDGNPTIELKARSTASNYHVHYFCVMRNNRLYQVGILRDGSYPSKKDVENFTRTFELLPLDGETAEAAE